MLFNVFRGIYSGSFDINENNAVLNSFKVPGHI